MRRLRQSINQPRRHGSQRPQCPPNQPTPTRCPANQPTTPVTDCVDDTGNLVTRNPGEGKAWPLTFHGQAEGQLLEGAELEGRLDAIASGTDLTFGTLL